MYAIVSHKIDRNIIKKSEMKTNFGLEMAKPTLEKPLLTKPIDNCLVSSLTKPQIPTIEHVNINVSCSPVQWAVRLISSKNTKNETLQAYQDQFGSNHSNPITTTATGTSNSVHPFQPLSQRGLVSKANLKSNKENFYHFQQTIIYNVVAIC